MMPLFLIATLIIAAGVMFWQKSLRALFTAAVAFAGFIFLYTVSMVWPALVSTTATTWSDGFWYVDRFAALLLILITFVYFMATLVSVRYIGHEEEEGILTTAQVRLYFTLLQLFVLSMVTAVLADNVMLLWIALEATTLSTTMLVALYKKDGSVEAAWKYIVLCSTGISLGLVGILMVSYAAATSGAPADQIFSLAYLRLHAASFAPDIMRWAFVFLFVGFGTKVGFVPMHPWLPDAHGKTPSPISAMLSGVLLNVALYGIFRFKAVTDIALGQTVWTEKFFLFFGLLSVVVPALIMLVQKNYKRMLAYSSVEHMGLTAFAIGLGPMGTVAAMMHMVGHTLTKSALFFTAGEVLLKWKTTKTEKIRNMLREAPYTAVLFLIGILAILAVPPFALFTSEYMMFRVGFTDHLALSLILGVSLTMVAYGMLRPTMTMLFAPEDGSEISQPKQKESWNITHTIVAIQLILAVCVGIWFMTADGTTFMSGVGAILSSAQ